MRKKLNNFFTATRPIHDLTNSKFTFKDYFVNNNDHQMYHLHLHMSVNTKVYVCIKVLDRYKFKFHIRSYRGVYEYILGRFTETTFFDFCQS